MRAKSWRFILTAALSIGIAGYALWAYGGGAQRVPLHPEMAATFQEHRVLITVHAMGASIALILGPFQFLERWRARHLRLHRMVGYGYLVLGVGMGGTAGVLMAPYSFGGFVSHLGFGMLGCLWLFTGAMLDCGDASPDRSASVVDGAKLRAGARGGHAEVVPSRVCDYRNPFRKHLPVDRLVLLGAKSDRRRVVHQTTGTSACLHAGRLIAEEITFDSTFNGSKIMKRLVAAAFIAFLGSSVAQLAAPPDSQHTFFVFAKIQDQVMPIERARKYEDPLNAALLEAKLGEVTGGGSMQAKDGTIEWVGIDIELADLSAALIFSKKTLRELGAPRGSVVEFKRGNNQLVETIHDD